MVAVFVMSAPPPIQRDRLSSSLSARDSKDEQELLALLERLDQECAAGTASVTGMIERRTVLQQLAECYEARENFDKALGCYTRAIEATEQETGPESVTLGALLCSAAGVHEAVEEYNEAETKYKRAMSIYQKSLGEDHADVGLLLNSLGRVQQV